MGEKSHREQGNIVRKKDNQGAPKGNRVRSWVAIVAFSYKYFDSVE